MCPTKHAHSFGCSISREHQTPLNSIFPSKQSGLNIHSKQLWDNPKQFLWTNSLPCVCEKIVGNFLLIVKVPAPPPGVYAMTR